MTEAVKAQVIELAIGIASGAPDLPPCLHALLAQRLAAALDRPGGRGRGRFARKRGCLTMLQGVMAILASRCAAWHDDLWLIDSTPVECGRSRETAKRSDLAGSAGSATAPATPATSGLRLHLIATPGGLPIAYALAHPKEDERTGPSPANCSRPTPSCSPNVVDRPAGREGCRSFEMQALLGHASLDTTRRYLEATAQGVRAPCGAIPPRWPCGPSSPRR